MPRPPRRRSRKWCGNRDCNNPSDPRISYNKTPYCCRDCAEIDIQRDVRGSIYGNYPDHETKKKARPRF